MVGIQTLSNIDDLRDSAFNQPPPRHGLRLLYWFASVNRNLRLDPTESTYGFHWFNNNNDGVELLPRGTYYKVGNLNTDGAEQLPRYLRDPKRKYYGEQNKDRVVVSVKNGWIDQVYVTEHNDKGLSFNRERTYRIDRELLNTISDMSKDNFLNTMNPWTFTPHSNYNDEQQNDDDDDNDDGGGGGGGGGGFWSYCTIL